MLLFFLLFVAIAVALWLLKTIFPASLDFRVIQAGNAVLWIATMGSFYFYRKAQQNQNVQAFLRAMYSAMFLRMVICIAAALTYILTMRAAVDKFALLACFGLYLIYSFAEVKLFLLISKQQKNA